MKLRQYLEAEGRDLSTFPIHGGLMANSTPDEWAQHVELWRQVGATQISLHTTWAGFETLAQHIDPGRKLYEMMRG